MLSQVASGRHHAVGRSDEATKAREQRISRTRVSAPKLDANGAVVGTLVAAICRENGDAWIDSTWLFVGLVRVHHGSLLNARKPEIKPAMKLGRSSLWRNFWSDVSAAVSVVLHYSQVSRITVWVE